jgi:PAS domain S-box-containing protein
VHRIYGHEDTSGPAPPIDSGIESYHPDDQPVVREAFAEAVQEGNPYDIEARLITEGGEKRWVRTRGEPQWDSEGEEGQEEGREEGEVVRVRGTIQDITERKEAERRLERRAELDRMIVEISSRFIDAPTGHLDAEIREALGRVGSFVGADRSYVFLYDGDPETGPMEEVTKSNTHEWCAEGTEPQKENLQSIPCSALPWWTGQMCQKEPLSIPSVADLPEPASATQEILEAQNIKSLVVLPMTQGGDLTGFVGFDATEGTVAWEEETITILQALSDNIAGALRRRGVEERLRETRDFYRQVLDQLPTELAIFDPEGRFEYVNPEGIGDPERREWAYGRTHEEYSRRWDLDSDLARHRDEAIREAAREEKTTRIEETISTEEGPLHYVRIHKPVTDGEGEVTSVVGCGLDVTKQVRSKKKLKKSKEKAERARREAEEARREAEQAREEAEEARREAEEASRAKSSLLANMSHEIRTPLTSVIGFAEAIGEDKSRADRFAPLIEKSGKRLLQTLDGVLNLSKLEAGQMELSEEAVGLATEAERTAEELRPEAKEKGIDLRLETGEAGARADEGGVQIVLRNLLSNAIKYTGEGGTVWVRTYREGGQAVLEVEDTGIGMEPEVAEDLFEPFRQASEGFNREYEGTGVGLAVTREATEQMGGTIEVETEEGEGSRFVVRLPQAGDAGSREAD